MKTRDDIYHEEAADLLRVVKTYRAILFDQALLLFPKKEDTVRTIIRNLIKHFLLCQRITQIGWLS